jgi:parallel beta-helix repeat protein
LTCFAKKQSLALLAGLFLLLGWSSQVRGQVTFDAASSTSTGSGSAISATFSHTTSGVDRILIVGVSIFGSVSSITYAGTSLALVGTATFPSEVRIEFWRLIAPATGTSNVVVTLSGSASFVAGASSFTGVHQTMPLGSFFSATSDAGNPTVDTLAVRDSTTVTVGAGQSQRWNAQTTNNIVIGRGSTEPHGGSSTVTMSWTLADQRQWALGAVALKAAPPPSYSISGAVFEDVNYWGGAGRSLAASAGSTRSNARVELYNGGGTFVSSTTTNASGAYSFSGLAAGNYTVRIVNSTVTSSRTGYVSTLIPVQTFRTDASSGSAVADTNRVGGEDPTKGDAASNTTSATLGSLNTGSATAQSITPVTVSSAVITGVDFGFNFDTIVNINNAGQGSLRQFITNSNALGNGGLAQAGLTAGVETSIFMISDGVAHPGLRAGLTNLFSGGTATITTASALPTITDASAAVDGTRQTAATGDSNPASSTSTGPEVTINLAGGGSLETQAANTLFDSLGVTNNTLTSTTGAGVLFTGSGVAGSILRNSTLWLNGNAGALLQTGAASVTITGNIMRNNGAGAGSGADGITLIGTSNITISNNQIFDNAAYGIDMLTGPNINNTVSGNTIRNNGFSTSVQSAGIGIRVGSNNTITGNTITANQGDGIIVNTGTGNTFSQNSIHANGELGIDLGGAEQGDGVTVNDAGDTDTGANDLLNFPVITGAFLSGGNLLLSGFARPGSVIEVFIAAPDPTGFGEGQTYLVTLTEGSAADADATTSTYTSPVGGNNVGTDTTNKFQFTIPTPAGVSLGTVLTASATLAGSTSEFSGNISVANAPPSIGLVESANPGGTQPPGTDLIYTIVYTNSGGQPANNFIIVDPNPLDIDPLERVLRHVDFKVGSMTSSTGTTGLVATFEYSDDGGITWTYTPVSGAGGAPAGYDRNVTNVRWVFAGSLSATVPDNTGSVGFTVRIR